jgi:hypothetical protein
MSKKKKNPVPPISKIDPWEILVSLIQEYGHACRADEMKGGGDPAEFELIEKELELTTLKVNVHIEKMKRDLE